MSRWTLLSHAYSSRSGSVNKELYVGIFRITVHLLVFTGDEQFQKIIQSTLRRTILDSYTWLNYFMILRRPLLLAHLLAPPAPSWHRPPLLAPPSTPGSSCPSHPLLALPIPDYPCEPVGTVDDSLRGPEGTDAPLALQLESSSLKGSPCHWATVPKTLTRFTRSSQSAFNKKSS